MTIQSCGSLRKHPAHDWQAREDWDDTPDWRPTGPRALEVRHCPGVYELTDEQWLAMTVTYGKDDTEHLLSDPVNAPRLLGAIERLEER